MPFAADPVLQQKRRRVVRHEVDVEAAFTLSAPATKHERVVVRITVNHMFVMDEYKLALVRDKQFRQQSKKSRLLPLEFL